MSCIKSHSQQIQHRTSRRPGCTLLLPVPHSSLIYWEGCLLTVHRCTLFQESHPPTGWPWTPTFPVSPPQTKGIHCQWHTSIGLPKVASPCPQAESVLWLQRSPGNLTKAKLDRDHTPALPPPESTAPVNFFLNEHLRLCFLGPQPETERKALHCLQGVWPAGTAP